MSNQIFSQQSFEDIEREHKPMRQGQQNRRGRGRNNNNNNNRKGQNPLTRSYESNGPDIKIRGTPAHVAEKYMSLARDAMVAGDPVLAENFLQHAEHYNRIILTHREHQQNAEQANGSANARHRQSGNASPVDDERSGGAKGKQPQMQSDAPQPSMQADAPPREQQTRTRQEGPRRNRSQNGSRNTASQGQNPSGQTRRDAPAPGRGRDRDRFGESDEQPEFLRRPVRRTRAAKAAAEDPASEPQPAVTSESVGEDQQD